MAVMTPKAFISYSWTTQEHKDRVREWAERLVADGVDVVLDLWNLKEGDNKFAFMERMVTDPSVTHVLLICDKLYAEKADTRKRGVGTESQIISKEVYDKVEQSKFIPVVCEFSHDENPSLPVFLKSRIYIDFSSPERVNENWERLIRLLFGKPLYERPALGKAPAYISEDSGPPASPARSKYSTLRQAILQNKKGIGFHRSDFIDACIEYADELRIRERPDVPNFGERVLEDCGKLTHVRDHIVDWILFESAAAPSEDFSEAVINVLERLLKLKARPPELNSWNDSWFDAHRVFVYEIFLYVVGALLKTQAYHDLHNVFTSRYLIASTELGESRFKQFDVFFASCEDLNAVLAPKGRKFHSPTAELVKRQSQREDIPFADIIQADVLIVLMAFVTGTRWYPQTLYYATYTREFPFFLRATQHKNFKKIATVTGIDNADKLRQTVKEGYDRSDASKWQSWGLDADLWSLMNMDKLDTVK